MQKNSKLYWTLFRATFHLSAFTFGGGFVIIPLMKQKFVDELKWIEEEEMLNLTAIAQSSPGAVAVNAALILGWRVAGLSGALVAILGTVMPPLIILTLISHFYQVFRDNRVVSAVLQGMQAGVAAVIIDVVISMGGKILREKNILRMLIMAGAFAATYLFGVNVVYIILVCGVAGAVQMIWANKKQKRGRGA